MLQRSAVLRDVSRGVRTRSGERPAEVEPDIRVEVEAMSPGDRTDLARDPEVVGVTPVMPTALVAPRAVPEAEAAQTAWGITAIGADASGLTGAGSTVAVLDTGADRTHAAFAGVTLEERDFSGSGNGDVNGHGTHCAGTIFGRDVEDTRIGVARGVDRALIGKVLGDDGSGSSEMIFAAIHWAATNGADVISMSLGFDFPGLVARLVTQGFPADLATSLALEAYRGNLRVFDALMDLVEAQAAFTNGTVVVAAAGNESRREVNPDYEIAAGLPAAAERVISVGAEAIKHTSTPTRSTAPCSPTATSTASTIPTRPSRLTRSCSAPSECRTTTNWCSQPWSSSPRTGWRRTSSSYFGGRSSSTGRFGPRSSRSSPPTTTCSW